MHACTTSTISREKTTSFCVNKRHSIRQLLCLNTMREAFPSLPFDTIDASKEKDITINWVGSSDKALTSNNSSTSSNKSGCAHHQQQKNIHNTATNNRTSIIGYTIESNCTPDYATSTSCSITKNNNNNNSTSSSSSNTTNTSTRTISTAAAVLQHSSPPSSAHQQQAVPHDGSPTTAASSSTGTTEYHTTTSTNTTNVASLLPHLPFSGELEELRHILHFPEEVALRLTDSEYQLFCQVSFSFFLSFFTPTQ